LIITSDGKVTAGFIINITAPASQCYNGKVKGKRGFVQRLVVNTPQSIQIWYAFSRDLTVIPAHPAFIWWRNEPYLPFPFQPKLVLIYRPRRDGRL